MVFVQIGDSKKVIWLEIDPDHTSVQCLMKEIERQTGFPVFFQQIYHCGRPLAVDSSVPCIADLKVGRKSTLSVEFNIKVDLVDREEPVAEEGVGIQERRKFRDLHTIMKPPANYVAGIGRGATGFSKSSDIGRARGAPYLPDRYYDFGECSPPRKEAKVALDPSPEGEERVRAPGSKNTEKCILNPEKLKKFRLFLRSFMLSSPKHPPVWIAAARLEEMAGKIDTARQIITKGCEECYSGSAKSADADIWIESCRLARPEEGKSIIAKGLQCIPNSVILWIQATKLERDVSIKKRVLTEGLKKIPECYKLWSMLIELCSEREELNKVLRTAAACGPVQPEFYIALAKSDSYPVGKTVLELARHRLPKEASLWIAASVLEGVNGYHTAAGNLIIDLLNMLSREGMTIAQGTWIAYADAAREAGSSATYRAIYSHVIDAQMLNN